MGRFFTVKRFSRDIGIEYAEICTVKYLPSSICFLTLECCCSFHSFDQDFPMFLNYGN